MGELATLFAPGTVAVIGATDRSGSVGRAILENLRADFDGEIVPVNPNRDEVLGMACFADVASAPSFDLAVVVLPPAAVVDVTREVAEAGVVFNAVPDAAFDELEADVIPFLEGRSVPVHGVLPRERRLSGVTVADLAEELGAEVLVEDGLDEYVERFSVGAMGADSALRRFRRTKSAVVDTGGDRSVIHTAALEAPGVRCLLLTGGHRPSGAVVGQAAEKGVPILAVRTDTLTATERAEDVVVASRTRDEETVRRMRTLLSDHADVDAILDR